MKKTLLFFILFLALVALAIGFLPSRIERSFTAEVNCTPDAVVRIFSTPGSWPRIWSLPENTKGPLAILGNRYDTRSTRINNLVLESYNQHSRSLLTLTYLPQTADKVLLEGKAVYLFAGSWWSKAKGWWEFMVLDKPLEKVFQSSADFFNQEEKLYGMKINRALVSYASLMSIKTYFDHVPNAAEIYVLHDSILQYVRAQNGTALEGPYVHVQEESPGKFFTMVAVATDRDLPSAPPFQLKNMIRKGRILEATVQGGTTRVAQASRELEHFKLDFKRNSPAIPYAHWVTHRLQEKDSSKWVTRLYYPVF